MPPPLVFLEWPPNRRADRAEIWHSLWGIFYATLVRKMWPGQVRIRSYDVIRGRASDRLFKETNTTELAIIDWNRDVMHDLGQNMTTSDLWHCTNDLVKIIRSHRPRMTPYIPIVANLAVFGVSWGPDTKLVINFSHSHAYSASLPQPCQSGSFAQFTRRRFCLWGLHCSRPGCYASQIFRQ